MGCCSSKVKIPIPARIVSNINKASVAAEEQPPSKAAEAVATSPSRRQQEDQPAPQPPAVPRPDPAPTSQPAQNPHSQAPQVPEFFLEKLPLSGKWFRLVNAMSEEIPQELSQPVEIGYHTGREKYQFEFAGQECVMDYNEGMLVMKRPDGDKEFSLTRKIFDFCSLEWTPENCSPRPFPEAIESYILSKKPLDAQFTLDGTVFIASLSRSQLIDATHEKTFPLAVVE